jgi:transposase
VSPEPEPVRLSDEDARKVAEYVWASGVSCRKAVPNVTRSHGTIYKWYKEFDRAAEEKDSAGRELVHA